LKTIHNEIKTIAEDQNNALWIGTPRGLMRMRDGKFAISAISNLKM
jgi:ligand-binding sensor domain-containing protein